MPSRGEEEALASAAAEPGEGEVERVAPPDLRNLRNRLLGLADDVVQIADDADLRSLVKAEEHADLSTAAEAYCRAAVHVAGLEAISAGQGIQVGGSGTYGQGDVAGAVWAVASETPGLDAEGFLRHVLEKLEGRD